MGTNLTFTSGIFFYDSKIDQRYDGFTTTDMVEVSDPSFAADSSIATLGSVNHGPVTPGCDQNSASRTVREAFAAYTQGVWDINDRLALTVGIRFAEDDLEGREANVQYTQTMDPLDALGLSLGEANILRGAPDPATLAPTGTVPLWLNGVPIIFWPVSTA